MSDLLLNSGPCEKYLADFCASALLKALKINLFLQIVEVFRSAEVRKSAREFSHVLNLRHSRFLQQSDEVR